MFYFVLYTYFHIWVSDLFLDVYLKMFMKYVFEFFKLKINDLRGAWVAQ